MPTPKHSRDAPEADIDAPSDPVRRFQRDVQAAAVAFIINMTGRQPR